MFISFFSRLVRTLTISRVAMYTVTILLGIVSYTAYENRALLVHEKTMQINPVGLTFTISDETKSILTQKVTSDEKVIGMSVLSADLRLNETETLYFIGDDDALNRVNTQLSATGNNRLPLFSTIEESNVAIIKLINGEFTCLKFSNTLMSRVYPELGSHVKMVCQASIPSYYGYFSGYVNVFLTEELSAEKQQLLKIVMDKISTDIYFRDVIPTQRSIKK